MKTHRLSGLLPGCGLAALALVYAIWTLCDTLTELGGDSATYLLMARALSPFWPHDPTTAQALAGATYPPGFPLLVGLLGGSFMAGHGVVLLGLLLALYLLYRWLRDEGLGTAGSAAAVLLFAAMPGTYLLTLNLWSENVYLACSLLAILAVGRAQALVPSARWWWIAALATAAALMVRTAGLPLLAALSLLLVAYRPGRWPALLLAAWLPFLSWLAWSHHHASGANLYAGQLLALYGHDGLAHLRDQVALEGAVLYSAWLSDWLGAAAPRELIGVIAAFGVLCLLGFIVRLVRLRFDALYGLLYVLMLLAWPWPGEAPRLSYVLIPVFMGQGLLLAWRLADRSGLRIAAMLKLALPGLLGLALLPDLLVTLQRRLLPVPPELAVVRHIGAYYSEDPRQGVAAAWMQARLIADLPKLADEVPAADCIFQIKPAVVMLLSGRRSLAPPPPATDDRTFAQKIGQCRYAYVMSLQSPTFPAPYYPLDRLGAQYHVIRQLPDVSSPNGGPLAALVELTPPLP